MWVLFLGLLSRHERSARLGVCVYSITCLSWPQYWPQSVQIIESGAGHLTRWANNVEHGTNRSSSSTGNSFDRLHHHYQWRRAQANTLHKVTPKLWKINRLNICAFWLIWSVGNERRWSRWVEQCVCVCDEKRPRNRSAGLDLTETELKKSDISVIV